MSNDMKAIEIARRLAQLGEAEKACQAYILSIPDSRRDDDPLAEMEAAIYILQNGGNYKVAYDCFRGLYDRGHFREDCLSIMTQAFYEPNEKAMKTRYEKNCKLLEKYPYLFRKDFLPFAWLPIRFYPYDDNSYTPFHREEERFGDHINFRHPVISRHFFKDLEKPILASDVYSMYELEYLNDNVRPSEWVAKENHIYLHYTDWGTFCAHLQVLNLRELLEDKKFVFLIGDEIEQYPIDFKKRFGLDYSKNPIKPIGFREINRLIWHTQLSAHNGGDYFNEIFDGHPNLLCSTSLMMQSVMDCVESMKKTFREGGEVSLPCVGEGKAPIMRQLQFQLMQMSHRTDKDYFVVAYIGLCDISGLDPASRIAPAIFFQPHYHNYNSKLTPDGRGRVTLDLEGFQALRNFPAFYQFKYIKTFTPMRRPTNSLAATVRFMERQVLAEPEDGKSYKHYADELTERLVNRSYMVDWEDRAFRDSVLVRFEDGKLNPKATFTALAAFLDLPYTESMTYCSFDGKRLEGPDGSGVGTDVGSVYRTYDDHLDVHERYFLEYFLRDVYERYGYDFNYYDGAPMDPERIQELLSSMKSFTERIHAARRRWLDHNMFAENANEYELDAIRDELMRQEREALVKNRTQVAGNLLHGLKFVNKQGRPLNFMPMLELDPELLERPLYH